jgi:hypothetical protein
MPSKYFIAVCDILGFSNLVRDHELHAVVEQSLGWFRKALNHSVHKMNFPSDVPPTADLDRHPEVGIAWFSDTILFYTKEDTDEAIQQLLATIAWLLFETILTGKTRIRGGLAYGEALIDIKNSLFVGRPIIEAHELERSQQWSGAARAISYRTASRIGANRDLCGLVADALRCAAKYRGYNKETCDKLESWHS